MILVFAGAGASAAIDSKKYPTTEGFFNNLSESIKNDPLFVVVKEFLETSNVNPLDIEHVLDALEKIRDYLWLTNDSSCVTGWMARQNYFTRINKNCDISYLYKSSHGLINHCSDLISRIHTLLYTLYSTPPGEKQLERWRLLLKELQEIDPIIEIFTTNYDMVLEYAINIDYLNIDSGKSFDGRHTSLNMKLWDNPGIPLIEGCGRLTKLHGSVDWQRFIGNEELIFTSPIFTGDLQKQLVLYPGATKKEPEEWPFTKFYKHLEKSAADAKASVFIGFSFRDEHINRILRENSTRTRKYIITKESPHPIPDFMQSNSEAKHNDKGFAMDSIKDCLLHLS